MLILLLLNHSTVAYKQYTQNYPPLPPLIFITICVYNSYVMEDRLIDPSITLHCPSIYEYLNNTVL